MRHTYVFLPELSDYGRLVRREPRGESRDTLLILDFTGRQMPPPKWEREQKPEERKTEHSDHPECALHVCFGVRAHELCMCVCVYVHVCAPHGLYSIPDLLTELQDGHFTDVLHAGLDDSHMAFSCIITGG